MQMLRGACLLGLLTQLLACGGSDGSGGGASGTGATGGGATGGLGGAVTGGSGGATGGSGGATGGSGGSGGTTSKPCALPNRDFWTWDLSQMPPPNVQVNAKCVAESDHAYVFVAQTTWDSGGMTQAQVDTIVDAFENKTPAAPGRGIYATDTETFGAPPDVDGDPRIILFYYPLGEFKGQSFDGYFRNSDQSTGPNSNMAEMLHLNATGSYEPDSDYMLGVVIHELVHLINFKYDTSEEGWLSEALAESAMTLAGYSTDLPAGKAYVTSTSSTPLCVSDYPSYGAAFGWGSYMLDRWGATFLKDVSQDPADGAASLDAHFGSGQNFRSAFGEFMVANLLDQPGIGDGRYGYKSIDMSALGAETAGVIDGAEHSSSAIAWGARMLRLTPASAGTLEITLSSTDFAKLVVHSVLFDPAQPGSAEITAQPVASASQTFSLTVPAGKVVDLVVAIDGGKAVASSGATSTSFKYVAKLTP